MKEYSLMGKIGSFKLQIFCSSQNALGQKEKFYIIFIITNVLIIINNSNNYNYYCFNMIIIINNNGSNKLIIITWLYQFISYWKVVFTIDFLT
jgi:hypothetical protein